MFCIYCGKQIADDSKFCPECGTPTAKEPCEKQSVPDSAPVSNSPKEKEPIEAATQKTESETSSLFNVETKGEAATTQELTFNKSKQIGTVTYKRTKTVVKVTASQLKIDQVAKKAFFKEKHTKKEVPLDTIEKIDIHTVLDFWDTLYAVAFTVLGFFQPVLFLGAAICFWCGYGKEIKITLCNGEIVKIPAANAKEETKALLDICIEVQNSNSLREASNNTRAKRNYKVLVGIVAALAIVIVVFAVKLFGDKSAHVLRDNLTLDGEYAIALDAVLEEGYMYLNFNATDKGLLEFYTSDAPEDVISLKYEILPIEGDIEGIKTYALKGYNDELPKGIVIFTFYQIDEQAFSVEFSEEVMGVSDINGVMVPFTEEYGFGGDLTDSEPLVEPIISNLPEWCSGSYYGDDLYSNMSFKPESGTFDIFIYRLATIENCVVTEKSENQISFTGKFDVDVGSVSGTLTNYGGNDVTLTITESDWSYFPAGTMMEFYYDYRDPNYLSHKNNSSVYGMTGIYASTEIAANRIFVWETDGMVYLSMTNRGESIGLLELSEWNIESNNDILYFSSYTLSGEEVSGSYDPITETLELWPAEDDSMLMAYGLSGFFLKQLD